MAGCAASNDDDIKKFCAGAEALFATNKRESKVMDSSCGRMLLLFVRFLVTAAMVRVTSAQDDGPTGEENR